MKKIGFLINPIAGMGGKVALKGTDGKEILAEAIIRGATPIAEKKAEQFFTELINSSLNKQLKFIIPQGKMGLDILQKNSKLIDAINYSILERISIPNTTTSLDTEAVVKELLLEKVELIIFVGGDGTAQDIHCVVGLNCPILGIPSGVKIHSGVFAQSVSKSVTIISRFLQDQVEFNEADIIDLDEAAFREGSLNSRLYGSCIVPQAPSLMQLTKTHMKYTDSEENNILGIIRYLNEEIKPEILYFLGGGSTIYKISRAFNSNVQNSKTLLGIDAVLDGRIIQTDLTESDILSLLDKYSAKSIRIVVTPIGGQGFILGRGNQQLSPEVIRKAGLDSIFIISTRSKIDNLPYRTLHVDTGDSKLDAQLIGYQKVLVDYNEYWVLKIE